MGGFELLARDGLARIGRFPTPHGVIETPALLPVVHPDPARQPVAPTELRRRFGLKAVITSSYIIWRTPPLAAIAEERGVHGLLGFDGPVMTDSGAFQQHAYGHVEVTDSQILAFQGRIGTDIATVLDVFVEPDAPRDVAEAGVRETSRRATQARAGRAGLLAVPVQGGLDPDLRRQSAAAASSTGDVLAVGGVVPLMERYRFADLARVLIAARPALAPEGVVHLFGTGHPMTFAFAALFGVDLFDSSAYLKFARRGTLMFPEGSVSIDGIQENICRCALCEHVPLTEVRDLPPPERETRIAEHNLLVCSEEVGRIRQAIRDGTMWELAERRSTGHPALAAGMRAAIRGVRVFLPTEPESRRAFRTTVVTSGLRPAVIRFLARLDVFKSGRGPYKPIPFVPLTTAALRSIPAATIDGVPLFWEILRPVGLVPLELSDVYPVGCYLAPEEFDPPPRTGDLASALEGLPVDREQDWSEAWTRRQVEALLAWRYGPDLASALLAVGVVGFRSHRTGRLRRIERDGTILFHLGSEGIVRPTFEGGRALRAHLPAPANRIVVAPDAVPFVREGRSLFSRFVSGGDRTLVPGASALLVDESDVLLAVGRLVLAPGEMGRMPRGVAVEVTAHERGERAPEVEDEAPSPAATL
ncbi:MAG: tRNA guanosine(15) transglycosylase TgtA [Thermoplasmata archaeon]|nr:tRNA guanosine(15) transglycosylase TgtA [Thermoplasmata archaeon]MCI4355649.1 tRNA guanosine(15) transglycosylase TgtA [Thermoplasmata archaeon]